MPRHNRRLQPGCGDSGAPRTTSVEPDCISVGAYGVRFLSRTEQAAVDSTRAAQCNLMAEAALGHSWSLFVHPRPRSPRLSGLSPVVGGTRVLGKCSQWFLQEQRGLYSLVANQAVHFTSTHPFNLLLKRSIFLPFTCSYSLIPEW